ncbi:GA20OX1 [Symbiodinium necroappetens]|uniref:GA20OX1 protein n=1 Tax=Symbiodinium necroappetens TaxID=1628268 RepID=A0A812ZRJ7_9DINO|nr:GA20OX1 [Symbiodinium necroappetens]
MTVDLEWLERGNASQNWRTSPKRRHAPLKSRATSPQGELKASARCVPKVASGRREPQLVGLRHNASRKTLAEAMAAGPWQVATWRGTGTMLSVHHAAMQSAEMGRHFRACAWAKAAEDRARAAEWARRRREKGHLKVGGVDVLSEKHQDQAEGTELLAEPTRCPLCGAALTALTDFDCCDCMQRSITGPLEKDRSQEASVSKQTSLQAASRRASLARRMSLQVGRRQSADMDGLGVGRQASDRRKSNEKQKKPATLTRLQRLIQAKRMEFDALPEGKKERFRSAYDQAVAGQGGLGGQQLRQALADLGLAGRQNHEKEAVHEVVRESIAAGLVDFLEFVFQVVPKVEQKLVEAKSPKLLSLFNQLDVAMAGSLSCSDCIEALRRHADSFITVLDGDIMEQFWPIFVKELAQQHKVSKHSDETIDFANFQRLASEVEVRLFAFQGQMEERAARSAGLPPALEAAHFGEIAVMMRYFYRYEKHQRGLLGTQELVMALMDSGTLPTVGRLHMTTVSNFATRNNRLSVYRFPDFLEQVDSLRREEKSQREAAFKSWYTIHKWADDKAIAVTDMPQLIMDLSLVADSCRSVMDVRALVEDCHKSGAEFLQIDASTELCNRVVESARVAARRREALVAEQVKLSEEQVFDMRGCFSEMTHSGVIGPDDLHYLLVELFPDHEIDDAFVQELLDLALPSGYFHSSSKSASSSAPRAAKPSESNPSKSKAAQAQEDEAAAHRKVLEESILRFDGPLARNYTRPSYQF